MTRGRSPPMLGNMRKHPMLDLIPLTGPWRKVPHIDRDPNLIGQLLKFHLPQPIAAGIAPPAIGGGEQRRGGGLPPPAPLPPPPAEGCDGKFGGVAVHPHTDHTRIVRWMLQHPRSNHTHAL